MSTTDGRFEQYIASMPRDYKNSFDEDDQRAHEAIVRRRGLNKTHVEIWRELSGRIVAICVVADDKPGLLSCISAALVATRIDVVGANAYCRKREDGSIEAIDLLWIRRIANAKGVVPPLRARDIMAVAAAIEEAAGTGTREPIDSIASQRVATVASIAAVDVLDYAPVAARIRFDNDPKDGSTVLTVEAVDRPGLLLAVTQALFHAGLQIIGLRATTEEGAAVDSFHIAEVDGSALRPERLLTLQTAILGAIDVGTRPPERRSAS